jgi:hypothetical protein
MAAAAGKIGKLRRDRIAHAGASSAAPAPGMEAFTGEGREALAE